MGIIFRRHITQYHENTAFPLTPLSTTILVCLNTFTYRFALKPIAFIAAAVKVAQRTRSMSLIIFELPYVLVSVAKDECAEA